MNAKIIPFIQDLLDNGTPKLDNLSQEERKHHRFNLGVLGALVSENFFDLPKLPNNKHERAGFFYSLPYFDDETLWVMENTRMVLVVYEVKVSATSRSSFCPLSIEVKTTDKNNFCVIVNDQSGQRTIKRNMLSCENGKYFTELSDYGNLTLSQLLNYGK
jgi:hypothetical protein